MSLEVARDRLASLLKTHDLRVVFAESCTAGLCSATLAQVDSISDHLCGSAATYIPELKQAWLKVSTESIEQHTCESQQVASEMATGAIDMAPMAHWSAAVVGHLASDLECVAFVAVARRNQAGEVTIVSTVDRPLGAATRVERQREAAELVLQLLAEAIQRQARSASE